MSEKKAKALRRDFRKAHGRTKSKAYFLETFLVFCLVEKEWVKKEKQRVVADKERRMYKQAKREAKTKGTVCR